MRKQLQLEPVAANIAAAYGRVSSDEQAGNASTRGQGAEAEEYCTEKKLNLVYTYFDEARSGKSVEGREQLKLMMADARAGKFSHLVVWKLTRLSRNLVETLAIIKELDELGVSVHSITEREYDTSTPAGRMYLHIMASVAEFEREVIVENVRMGMKQRALEGAWIGGEMLGYRVPVENEDPEDAVKAGRLIIVTGEAAIVKQIFDLYLSGCGIKAIANKLNKDGHKTKRNRFFSPSQVGAIIDNPAYAGIARTRIIDSHAKEAREIVVEDAHPPIVSRIQWDAAKTKRAESKKWPRHVSKRGFPLTGVLRCPECGGGMVMHRTTNTRKNGTKWVQHYYACGKWKGQGTAACHSNCIIAEDAEKAVFRQLKRVVTHPTLLREVVKQMNVQQRDESRPSKQRLPAIEKERRRLELARDRYLSAFERGALDEGDLSARLAEIRESLRDLAREEADIRVQLANQPIIPAVPYEAVKIIMDDFVAQLQYSDADKQRVLLRILVSGITFEKGKGIKKINLRFHAGVALALGLDGVPPIDATVLLTA